MWLRNSQLGVVLEEFAIEVAVEFVQLGEYFGQWGGGVVLITQLGHEGQMRVVDLVLEGELWLNYHCFALVHVMKAILVSWLIGLVLR